MEEKLRLSERLSMHRSGTPLDIDETRRMALRDSVSLGVIEEALKKGAEARYEFFISKIYAGHKGYEDSARKLAEEHNFSLMPLGEALNFND